MVACSRCEARWVNAPSEVLCVSRLLAGCGAPTPAGVRGLERCSARRAASIPIANATLVERQNVQQALAPMGPDSDLPSVCCP